MIWNSYERFLWGVAITLAFMVGIYYITQGRKREIIQERVIMYGFACLILCFGISRIIMYFADFQFEGTYVNNTFYANIGDEAFFYNALQNLVISIGSTLFILSFEVIFKKTRYLLTLINVSLLAIFFVVLFTSSSHFALFNFSQVYLTIFNFLNGFMLYLCIRWSRLEFKGIILLMAFGYILIVTALVISSYPMKILNLVPLELCPIYFIVGCVLIIFPMLVDPEIFSKTMAYYVIVVAIAIGHQIIWIYYQIVYGEIFEAYALGIFATGIYEIIIFYLVLKNIRSAMITERDREDYKNIIDIGEFFSKSRKVTEEEVSVAKEKMICLVCKTKLARTMYICPKCATFYCKKCSDALSDVENMCWVCDTPFDITKPVKKLEEKEEEVAFEKK